MTALPVSDNGVEDPLQEVQSLQKDLKAFSRAVNKPLRDNIIYPTFTLASPQSSRKGLPISQNPGDVAILDRLKIIRGLPGKARTSALVRQALTLQDSNVRAPSTSSTPPVSQRHRKESAQQTPRLDQAGIPTDSFAPVTAADFQDQLYDASGAIDLTRVRLKIKQHQQDLIAAGLQAPPEEPGPAVLEGAPQEALQAKLHWQLAAGQRNPASGANYTLSQHETQKTHTQDWAHPRKLWEDEQTASTSQPQQSVDELEQQRSGQLPQQFPGHVAHHMSGQLQQQSEALDPSWSQALGSTAQPQETRHDNSTAAYYALLSEEAQRMLRHAPQDSTHLNARSLLRTPQHLVPLVEACKTLRGLQILDLSLNALSDSALTQLQDLADCGVQLTSLDLSQNQFSSQAAAPICRIISHISHVGLSQSHPTSALLPRLASTSGSGAQDSPASGSRNLDAAAQAADNQDPEMVEPAASPAAGEADAAAPSSAAAGQVVTAASQQEFGGSHSRLAGAASTSGSGVVSTVPSLKRLVLSHNPLGDRGLAGLAGGCPKGQGVALIELGLEDCRLGCLCANPLGAIMQDWASLRQLTLSWNDLGIRGAQAVAQALRANRTLISLDLSHCGLTDMGGAQIALSLAGNSCQLQHLRLDLNPLGKQGAVVLVKATASSGCKLQQLQMHGCGIADVGFIQGAIKLRAEEALASVKGPKKKAKKKKKGGKAKEEPAGAKKKKAPPPAAPAAKPGLEHHALNLEQPSDWAALVGLVQTARSGAVTWKNLTLAGKKRPGPLPPENWPAEIPMTGKVEFDVKAVVTTPGEAAASAAASTAGAAAILEDSFCQLFSANLRRESQCLDDWRLQLLELLPAAQLQLTQAQACSRQLCVKN
ncbi:MAG: hypothetical protein FRX49_02232 [Trebouxia sp. A1-2]|nr:MAG: hypothetical protein FRX49_02232 [Trebouxia sp. A1-2]